MIFINCQNKYSNCQNKYIRIILHDTHIKIMTKIHKKTKTNIIEFIYQLSKEIITLQQIYIVLQI